jgi:hypothetical protein
MRSRHQGWKSDVLTDMLGFSSAEAAHMLGILASTVRAHA